MFGINRLMYQFDDTIIYSNNEKPSKRELQQCRPPSWYLNKQCSQQQKIIELENELQESEKQYSLLVNGIKKRYLIFLKSKYKEEKELNEQIQKAKSLSLEDMQSIMYE